MASLGVSLCRIGNGGRILASFQETTADLVAAPAVIRQSLTRRNVASWHFAAFAATQ
jgi:hypothetical protein